MRKKTKITLAATAVATPVLVVLLFFGVKTAHTELRPVTEPVFSNILERGNSTWYDRVQITPDTLIELQLRLILQGDTVLNIITKQREWGERYLWQNWFSSRFIVRDYYDTLAQLNAQKLNIKP